MELSDQLHDLAQAVKTMHVAINNSFDTMAANIITVINESFARHDEQLRRAAEEYRRSAEEHCRLAEEHR
jgi:hypothetical protein